MNTDISYLLYWDDDAIPIDGNMTLGNHLDNDIVVAGEDVHDFHARIDITDRGPIVIPLGESTVSINGTELSKPMQVILGDVIGIGQATMQIGVEVEAQSGAEAEAWALHGADGAVYPIHGEIMIGRAEGMDICIPKEHISRRHARLFERHQHVWLQDLNSANGTRINNTPLIGGARLFHGDYIYFDKEAFQLIGSGGDLTPVPIRADPRSDPQQLQGTKARMPNKPVDTTEFAVINEPEPPQLIHDVALTETGAFLLGISESVDGQIFRVGLGETILGRGDHCNVVINDSTVSHEHAQIKVRPEGVTITNLMSTNGTKINGVDVTSAKLGDGDVVRLGRVSLMFKDIPPASLEGYPLYQRASFWFLTGTFVLAGLLGYLWFA